MFSFLLIQLNNSGVKAEAVQVKLITSIIIIKGRRISLFKVLMCVYAESLVFPEEGFKIDR